MRLEIFETDDEKAGIYIIAVTAKLSNTLETKNSDLIIRLDLIKSPS